MTLQTGDRFHSSSRQESISNTVRNGSFEDSDSIASISYKNTQSHELLPLVLVFEWSRLWPSAFAFHILIREWKARIDECPIFKLWDASLSVHWFPSWKQPSPKERVRGMMKSGIPEFLQNFKQTGKSKRIAGLLKLGMEMIQREKGGGIDFETRQPIEYTRFHNLAPYYRMDPRNNSTIFRMEGWLSGRGV